MQCTLNFSDGEREQVAGFLASFRQLETKTRFEALRCRIGESTVTLYKSGKLLVQGKDCQAVKEKVLSGTSLDPPVVLGIDEAGRGEATGPFVVAAVLGKPNELRELRDSKKLRNIEGKRELVEKNALGIAVFSVSAKNLGLLREQGMTLNKIEAMAINAFYDFFKGLDKSLKVVVDGAPLKGCRKGVSFLVGGDDKNPVIGAASIVAKSERNNSKDTGTRPRWGSWQKKQ